MKITVITVGKIKEKYLKDAIAESGILPSEQRREGRIKKT